MYPTVKHFYDVWHVAKGKNYQHCNISDYALCISTGFRKKLEALAKQKDCELVARWQTQHD